MPLALAVGAATVVQAITSFSLSQIVSIAAQRAISDMRIEVQRHVLQASGLVLRRDEVRRADHARHDRRRRGTESHRDRSRSAHRRPADGDHRARGAVLSELAPHGVDDLRAAGVRRHDGGGVQAAAAAVPQAQRDQRRSHGPVRRGVRRDTDGEGLHGARSARSASSRTGSSGCSGTSRRRSPERRPSAPPRR